MTFFLTVVGALLVLVALRDIFYTLLRPQGAGTVARAVFSLVWRATSAWNRRGHRTEVSGPLGLLGVIGTWTLLVVAGWTLVYLPRMPEGFYFGSSLEPASSSDLVASIYLSLVAVTTLGFGDITPSDPLLRIGAPLQALIGFVLLTAGISWVLQIYPALGRRRAFAQWLATMRTTDGVEVVRSGEPSIASAVLARASGALSEVELDLVQYPETYYFREERPDLSLATQIDQALELARAGSVAQAMEVRHAAAVLSEQLDSLARTIALTYLKTGGDTRQVLDTFAQDHRQSASGAADGTDPARGEP